MVPLTGLKAILHSKRANIYYLEKCRVMHKGGRAPYLTEAKEEKHYQNIPIANTAVILFGTETSIAQAPIRMLASAGVLIGFSGRGDSVIIASNEIESPSTYSIKSIECYKRESRKQKGLIQSFFMGRKVSPGLFGCVVHSSLLKRAWNNLNN